MPRHSASRATNGTSGFGSTTEGTKTWVDARIKISPDATNEVGAHHTFTATFWVDDGTGVDSDGEMGSFDRAAGAQQRAGGCAGPFPER